MMEKPRAVPAGIVAAFLALGALSGAEAGESVSVYLADGSSLPLRSWTLSYEYMTYGKGESPAEAKVARKQTRSLYVGKKEYFLTGAKLEIQYKEASGTDAPPAPTGVTLVAEGKRTLLKMEPPQRTLLTPGGDSNLFFQVRSLDLLGETITGTKRSLCLLSFSVLVECAAAPEDRVIRIEFGP